MGEICFLVTEPETWMTDSIENAFNKAKIDYPQKYWLDYDIVKWIEEFAKSNPTDNEIKSGMKRLDEAILIISEISRANDNIISETSRAIKAGKPTIVITQNLNKAPVLMKRAKYIVEYDQKNENKGTELKNKLVECFKKIEIETEGKDWEHLINSINVPIYTLDKKEKIDFFNDAAADFFNIKATDVIGITPLDFMKLIQDSDSIQVHEKYTAIYEKQINESRIVLEKAIKEDKQKGLSVKDLVFEPLLFNIEGQGLKLCHLKVYNGGSDGSMCVFWSVDKRNTETAKEVLQALKDLTGSD